MMVTMQMPARGCSLVCSGIVMVSRARGDAGPFLFGRMQRGARDGVMQDQDAPSKTSASKTSASKTPASKTPASKAPRARVVARLWRTAERQVSEIEARLASLDGEPQALEREAKTLAIIAKTVRDLVAIDAEAREARNCPTCTEQDRTHGARKSRPIQAEDDEDPGPQDLEGFRAELARRLDQLRSEG